MGINPTPTNHRSFTFDGKSTREFGVYITGKDVFNAPERAVEMISIPGRDGEYALDQGHFNNIEVTYRAGIVSDSTTDFAEAISNFRNWLASREGYCRLTDEYNTEEYRMAVFKNAIALEHEGLLTGEFDVTFDCKPQRFLAIGEELTEIGAWGNTETAEGEVVTIDASSDTAVKALTVDIEPVQSGSGTPSPDNVRPISGWDAVTVTVADDVDNPTVSEDYTTTLPSTTYGGTLDVVSGLLTVTHLAVDMGTLSWNYNANWGGAGAFYATLSGVFSPQPTHIAADMISSIYPCVSRDILYGVNTQTAMALTGTSVSTRDSRYNSAASYKTAMSGEKLVYPLATPTTTTLTPQQVELLLGENNIFADSGNVKVEYGHNPTLLTNPTWFPSKPLLAVEGYGEIKFNNRSIVDIESGQLGDITIAKNISSSSIQIDGNLFNIGDTVTVSGAYQDIFIELKTDGTYYNIVRESESITDSNSDFSTAFFKDSPGTGQLPSEITYRITIPSFNITIGTNKTITDVVSGTISCKAKNPSANTFTATFTTTREYKYKASTNTITYNAYYSTVSTTAAYVVDAWLASQQVYFGSVVGHSTVSQLGNPTYIDCDIGEAYMIKDGEPISLNQYIDLGSDLPTLPSGDTEVTYDNTITKVEVKPNWWKV